MTQDEKLDEALKQTFPASDPFSLSPEKATTSTQAPAEAARADSAARCIKNPATTG